MIAGLAFCLLGLAPAPPRAPVNLVRLMDEDPAPTLEAYHLFDDSAVRRPNAGLTPYGLNTPLFSDYAAKQRYLYLPPGLQVKFVNRGPLDFPVGAVLVKTFAYPADFRRPAENLRWIETRLLIHRTSGWAALTYVWNDGQTRAVLKRAGLRVPVEFVDPAGDVRHIDYAVPNVNQCKECHAQSGAITPLGPKARNLNGDYSYDGGGRENQVTHWTRLGLLSGAPAVAGLGRTGRWDDLAAPLNLRARAYLDANCGHCHNREGLASNSGLYLTWEEADRSAFGFRKRPVAAGRGSGDGLFDIEPGHPEASILVYRMGSTEPGVAMPQIGRSMIDKEGLTLIRAYIKAMPPLP